MEMLFAIVGGVILAAALVATFFYYCLPSTSQPAVPARMDLLGAVNRDPLAAFGVGSAVIAFLVWAAPAPVFCVGTSVYSRFQCGQEYFSLDRLPAVAAFLALSLILLLLRRR